LVRLGALGYRHLALGLMLTCLGCEQNPRPPWRHVMLGLPCLCAGQTRTRGAWTGLPWTLTRPCSTWVWTRLNPQPPCIRPQTHPPTPLGSTNNPNSLRSGREPKSSPNPLGSGHRPKPPKPLGPDSIPNPNHPGSGHGPNPQPL
jgi:hypothetical protein